MSAAGKLRVTLLSASLIANGRDDVPDELKDRLAVAVGRLAEAQRRGLPVGEAVAFGEDALARWREFLADAGR